MSLYAHVPMSNHSLEVSDQSAEGSGYQKGSWLARHHQDLGYDGPFAYFLAGEYAGRRLSDSDARIAFFVAYRDVMARG